MIRKCVLLLLALTISFELSAKTSTENPASLIGIWSGSARYLSSTALKEAHGNLQRAVHSSYQTLKITQAGKGFCTFDFTYKIDSGKYYGMDTNGHKMNANRFTNMPCMYRHRKLYLALNYPVQFHCVLSKNSKKIMQCTYISSRNGYQIVLKSRLRKKILKKPQQS